MNGYRMRELREFAGLLQNEVAPELGLHYVTICKWEKSEKEIPRVYAESLTSLVNDVERVYRIKSTRRQRRREKRMAR